MKVSKRLGMARHGAIAVAVFAAFAGTPAAAESPLGARPTYGPAPNAAAAKPTGKVKPQLESQAVEAPNMSATDVQGENNDDRAKRRTRQPDAGNFGGIGYRLGP